MLSRRLPKRFWKKNSKKNDRNITIGHVDWKNVPDRSEGTHFESFEVFVAAMSGSKMLKQRAEKFDANIHKRGNVKLCMAPRSLPKRFWKKNSKKNDRNTTIGHVDWKSAADSAEGTRFASFEVFVAAMSGSRMLKQRAEKFDANINKRGNVKLCMALTWLQYRQSLTLTPLWMIPRLPPLIYLESFNAVVLPVIMLTFRLPFAECLQMKMIRDRRLEKQTTRQTQWEREMHVLACCQEKD